MKILFTLLSIGEKYSKSCTMLTQELLEYTPYDILISTNNLEYFPKYRQRVQVRENIESEVMLSYGSEFNYNLKYHAFKNIPEGYDAIIYLDCDIKSNFWTDKSTALIQELFLNHDFVATRLNCTITTQLKELDETGNCLFSHKLNSYDVKNWKNKSLYESKLPSEHFFGFRYNKQKLNTFYIKWRELNYQLQATGGTNKSWGDGFEIGVAAYAAGYHNSYDLDFGRQQTILGFQLNGNKL